MPDQLGYNLLLQIPNDLPMAHIGLVQPGLCVGYAPHESYSLDRVDPPQAGAREGAFKVLCIQLLDQWRSPGYIPMAALTLS